MSFVIDIVTGFKTRPAFVANGFGNFVQGVAYLVEKGMLVYEPRAVATFLLENCDKLDKTQVTLFPVPFYFCGCVLRVLFVPCERSLPPLSYFQRLRRDDVSPRWLSIFV